MPLTSQAVREASPATARANAFVAARLPAARELGGRLAGLLDDPDSFERELAGGFEALADPAYAAEQARVAPGVRDAIGVRWPLVHAVEAALARPLAAASPAIALYLADRLSRADLPEVRRFAHVPLRRSLPDDPERSWQIIRRLIRSATDWISVDSLADVVAQGILLERYRWAELEQLVYSRHRWERRLVGSTLARLPYALAPGRRSALAGTAGLSLIGSLIGDAEPDVQKALAWALRSWYLVDPRGVEEFLAAEARDAAATGDGYRAWVVRDALVALPAERRGAISDALSGLRRRPGAPSSSRAAEIARSFHGLPDAHALAEPPL